jgi:hypothetical protein
MRKIIVQVLESPILKTRVLGKIFTEKKREKVVERKREK